MLGASGGDKVWETGNRGHSAGKPANGSRTNLTSERGHMAPSSPEFATPTSSAWQLTLCSIEIAEAQQ